MVKLKEIKDYLESLVPLKEQDSWDNSGLQVGDGEAEIKKVGFALSVSLPVIKEAKEREVDLIITHHPLTISGVKSFTPNKYPSLLILELIRKNISVYSLHTNLDVSWLGPTALIGKEIKVRNPKPIVENPPYGLIGEVEEITQRELLTKLVNFLPPDAFRLVNYHSNQKVRKVAVCSGSCASFIDLVAEEADVFITGDVKYHDALKAQDLGLTVFDLGHFGTERLFYVQIKRLLEENFPSLDFCTLNEKSPFEVAYNAK
ncbi:Nif3-like dinuclear metal center hexameric protein [Thermovibrio sp.]